jgi:CubicO group peptidase (beta-lactamase class C family)
MKQKPSRLYQLAVLTASAVVAISLQAQTAHPPKPDTVEDCLRRQMKELHIPGMQVAVIRHGKIILEGVYGIADLQDSIPVTKTTVFPINSITKAFTGVAVMQLVEAGKLDLAAPVSQYLDGLPQPWQAVTLRQLLTHNSGIPNILDNNTGRLIVEGEDAAWAKVQTMPMEFATGEKFSYSQTNYLLLGRIIDKFSGEPFIRFISEKQLQVVGMPLTLFGDSHLVIPHSARDYSLVYGPDGKTRFNNLFEEFAPSILTASGMNSTADEMAHWILALQQGKLFKDKASLDILWTPGRLNNGKTAGFSQMMNGYALGWPAIVRPSHSAMAPIGGGRSGLFVYPDDDLTIIILTNKQGSFPEAFIDEVAGYYIPDMKFSTGFGFPPAVKSFHVEVMQRGGYQHLAEVLKDAKSQPSQDDLESLGSHLFVMGHREDAFIVLNQNVALHPDSPAAFELLAWEYNTDGKSELAKKNNDRAEALKKQK